MSDGPAFLRGVGAALPARVLGSADVEARLGLAPGWIEQRTGVRERRIADDGAGVSSLAVPAGREALRAAGIAPGEIDLLLLATSTPDHPLPPTAPRVAEELGIHGGSADLAAACTGFLTALVLAHRFLLAGGRGALVIGANILSRRVNWDDPRTASLFADGAGALALAPARDGADGLRILGSSLSSRGEAYGLIGIPAGGSVEPLTSEGLAAGRHTMALPRGDDLFRAAVRGMRVDARKALAAAGILPSEVDWLLPHQANRRMVDRVAADLAIDPVRTLSNVDRVGNTSAASIPILLCEAVATGRIRAGHTLLLTAAGAGLTSGAVVLRW